MTKTAWLYHRLSAMSVPEIFWRLSQRYIQKNEKKRYAKAPVLITAKVFNQTLENLTINERLLHLNLENTNFSLTTSLALLGGYEYETNKKNWHAGFQTDNLWPKTFSYDLVYKQRDDIGDARTNWELNRHFQFALLAKDFAASKEAKYLDEFIMLFTDWNRENPFLFGISWTSVMEVAIRLSNWCHAYCFLKATIESAEILEQLRIGIINMTDYVVNHYSRYSSANNHLIVEAFAIGQSGILLGHKPWLDLGVSLLTRELPRQNYSDGVNKELSLHYQSFYMEAMGLMLRLLVKNNQNVPETWVPMLEKMCKYVAACRGEYGEYIVFGDNDEGKILDLSGGEWNHYDNVLRFLSLLLPTCYIDIESPDDGSWCISENLRWLFTETDFRKMREKPFYQPEESVIYNEGGISILRSKDKRVLIGIDHGELGFGSIAAHGHADALSFQLFVDGEPLFLDPGTYIYHADLGSRNEFRKTRNHNTATIEGRDQSKMLGAFLWGKRARCRLIGIEKVADKILIKAEHDGYAPDVHRRTFAFSGEDELCIIDNFQSNANKEIHFILNPDADIKYESNSDVTVSIDGRQIAAVEFTVEGELDLLCEKISVSFRYGSKCEALKFSVKTRECKIESRIKLVLT